MATPQQFKCGSCNALITIEGQPGFCPQCGEPIVVAVPEAGQPPGPAAGRGLSERESLNVVTDTVVGPNLRVKDNLYQAIAIGISVLLCAGVGALIAVRVSPDNGRMAALGGAIAGGIVGLIVGTLGSGMFLMIYRFVRHVRGRHD